MTVTTSALMAAVLPANQKRNTLVQQQNLLRVSVQESAGMVSESLERSVMTELRMMGKDAQLIAKDLLMDGLALEELC